MGYYGERCVIEPQIECPECTRVYLRRELKCPACSHVAIPKLYRYVKFNKHSLDILENHRIWCPKASTLKDPFEFQFRLEGLSHQGVLVDQESIAQARRDVRKLGVVCLSEVDDSLLMWSHYADSHHGFCIEFERDEHNDLGNSEQCLPVVYQKEFPAFTLDEIEDKKATARILTTKSEEWAYEKEWRMITKKDISMIQLPGKITGVIFGSRMEPNERHRIGALLGPSVNYSVASPHRSRFRITLEGLGYEEVIAGVPGI